MNSEAINDQTHRNPDHPPLRRGEPIWRKIGDGLGTTLVVTDAGLLAIGIEPVVVKTVAAIRKHAAEEPVPKPPTPRAGTKQAMLIGLLQAPSGATMEEIVVATGWMAHTARGAMSGALGKKLGLVVTSAKEEGRGRVYRIDLCPNFPPALRGVLGAKSLTLSGHLVDDPSL
ncbi:putative DUF3489 family protein [Octadecabacter antarcticus 307]|uniref:Putative DUF3489 family protein n=1 Tax=Octadecabacter antarcticus 307 TaxID=391626 RepID=M9R2W8_9RHOB|nr:putative DUF3489 family protein [Octadecabacter antarcticus 307]